MMIRSDSRSYLVCGREVSILFALSSLVLLLLFPPASLAEDLDSEYKAAVEDAVVPEPGEISHSLLAINPDDKQLVWNDDHTKLLVVTWKSADAYEKFIKPGTATSNNEDYVVWVTLAPQVQNFCRRFIADKSGSQEALNLRLKQLLGLNSSWNYDVFVELWVSPEDMFRPCVDPETNDSTCELDFNQPPPTVKNIRDYKSFYKNLYFKSFRGAPGVPWTGLGYTYDWGNPDSEVGASEFILVPGTAYDVKRAIPTMEYCAQEQ